MSDSVTWMWFGNTGQINSTPGTPATEGEARSVIGDTAAGPDQIRPVTLQTDPRVIHTAQGRSLAYATTFNGNEGGASDFTYPSPADGDTVVSQVTGFLRVDYELTFPDGSTDTQEGVLIQMANGDRFFRPSRDDLADWDNVDALSSIKIVNASPLSSNTYVAPISFSPGIMNLSVPCFAAGTMIRTQTGDRAVETLQIGDMIWTRDAGYQPLRWIGTRRFDAVDLAAQPRLRPIRIEAGALGDAQPVRPLLVSRQHRILIRSAIAQRMFGTSEILAPAFQLADLPGIDTDMSAQSVTYCHLMFDAHQVVMSDGALTESLYPGAQALLALGTAATSEIEAIFPGILSRDCPASARPLTRGPKLRRLVQRHVENERHLVS